MRSSQNQILLGWLAVGALALAAGRVFHADTIQPIRQRELATERSIEKMQGRIADARRVTSEVAVLEGQRRREQKELHALLATRPAGSSHVWFPQQMRECFAGTGSGAAVTRLNTTLPAPELPGFERTYWAVELPVGKTAEETREISLAVAAVEPRDPFVRILDLAIRPDAEDPQRRVLVLNVVLLAPAQVSAERSL